MLKESQLFTLLDKALNQISYVRKGEEAVFFCPFCSHYKRKLEINVRTQSWHCWVCNARGKSIYSLFNKLKVKDSYFDDLYKIVGRHWKRTEKEEINQHMSLPDEFIPLWDRPSSFDYGEAMSYLKGRGISIDDILRYNIGFCDSGIYKQRIIIPSYDKNGDINFFAARSYQKETAYKYMLSPWPKDIVGFELFINWEEPITLVEGTFDAIAVKNNAIPLFGNVMTFALKLAIVMNGVKKVNIVLDNDALSKAMDIYDRIEDLQVNNIDICLVKLEDKDPSVLGFEAVNKLIDKSTPLNFSDVIKIKLNT